MSPLLSHAKVISAHNLPKPQGSGAKGEFIDPYVVLELHGVPADCAEQRTRTAAQNQDDPLFDETFEFQVRLWLHSHGLDFIKVPQSNIGKNTLIRYLK